MASIWPQRISAGYCLYRHHDRRCGGKGIKDLLRKDFRSEIVIFRARRRKNYEAYTAYMLNNFFKVVAEIWKLQQNNLYAVGLISSYANFFSWRCTRSNRRMSSA